MGVRLGGPPGALYPISLSALAFCRGVSRVGRFALLCWSLENCTGSERDRPCRHVLICRFGAS